MDIKDFKEFPESMLNEISITDLNKLTEIETETAENEIKEKETEANEKENEVDFKVKNDSQPTSIDLASLLTPETAVFLLDSIAPLAFVAILQAFNLRVKKGDLQLTVKEKQTIEPMVEQCLQQMNILIKNPFVALALSLGIFYGSKALELGLIAKGQQKAKVKTEVNESGETIIKKDNRGRPKGSKNLSKTEN